jgi:hypothetical protein
MSVSVSGGRLAVMKISTHGLPEAHPVDTAWVDEALATAYRAGDPLGALIGYPLDGGEGIMIVGWPDGGPGRFTLIEARTGLGTGPARYMQVVAFDAPRSPEWAAAEQLAATHRLWPAAQGVPGIVRALRLRDEHNALTVVTLAETAEAIEQAVRAIMSTWLLPGEDPAVFTGPDRVGVYRLMHADLPVEASAEAQTGRSRT